jgi:O-antigen/teichoic acid export membrane protein
MQQKRRAVLNALFSVVQVVVNAGLYLVLYRFLYDTVGVEMLGVWSVVMAWTSVNNLANLGLGGSTTYYIPKYQARGESAYVLELVQTGILSAAGAVGVGLVLFYPLVRGLLRLVITDPALLPVASEIVPYAFASIWMTATAGIVYASIDGLQRVDLRNVILVAGALAFLVGALILVPDRGVTGLAQAQLVQAATVLASSWLVLRVLLPSLPLLPVRWSRRAFSEMIGYSVRFQLMSIALLLFEPVTKSLLARFGTVSAVGYFEMANRLAMQLRSLIMTAHTALVPTLTDIGETAPALLRGIYETSCRLIAFLQLLSLPLLVGLTPIISVLWIGSYEPTFVLFATLLFIAWFGNLIAAPAYVGYLGEGDLRWNLRSHVLTGVLNIILGVAGGSLFGGTGVVIGFVAGLLAGSLMVAIAYSVEHDTALATWIAPENLVLAASTLGAMAAVLLLYYRMGAELSVVELCAASLGVYALFAGVPAWRHSSRRKLHAWARHAMIPGSARPA